VLVVVALWALACTALLLAWWWAAR